jgi:O-acetyl-ADP-ribose deacetylase (regulator of RNase III)
MKTIKGDLIKLAEKGNFDIIIQGCNCYNVMGGGLAKQLADRYPKVKQADMCTTRGDKLKLGRFTTAQINTGKTIFTVINAYTQYEMSNTKDVFEYGAFEKFLELFSKCVPDYTQGPHRKVSIGFPQIGAGLAGGDWSRISKMIEKFSEDVSDYADVTVVEYQP